jgi:hypothetical protein
MRPAAGAMPRIIRRNFQQSVHFKEMSQSADPVLGDFPQ